MNENPTFLLGQNNMLDVYGTRQMTIRALKKEKKRLSSLSKVHHQKCNECDKKGCRNPYTPILASIQAELTNREQLAKPVYRTYLAKLVRLLTKKA